MRQYSLEPLCACRSGPNVPQWSMAGGDVRYRVCCRRFPGGPGIAADGRAGLAEHAAWQHCGNGTTGAGCELRISVAKWALPSVAIRRSVCTFRNEWQFGQQQSTRIGQPTIVIICVLHIHYPSTYEHLRCNIDNLDLTANHLHESVDGRFAFKDSAVFAFAETIIIENEESALCKKLPG